MTDYSDGITRLWLGLGATSLEADPQAGLVRISAILQSQPTNHEALLRLVQLNFLLGDKIGEEQALRLLIAAHVRDMTGWLGLSSLLRRSRRADEAIALCDKALGVWPDEPRFFLEQALADEAAGRIVQAGDVLARLVAAQPGFSLGHLERHYFHMRHSNYSAALTAAEDMVAAVPNEPLGWVARAVALHHLERFDEAGAICRIILAKRPDFAPPPPPPPRSFYPWV